MRLIRFSVLVFLLAVSTVLVGCEAVSSQGRPDDEVVGEKVAKYLGDLFPHLQNVEVVEVAKQDHIPFYRAVA